MKRYLVSISLMASLMVCSLNLRAQFVIKAADEQYNLFNYSKAATLYLQAWQKKQSLYTAEHLATCYRLIQDYVNTEKWYAKAVAMPDCPREDFFLYAEVLKTNSKYEEAKKQYTRYYVSGSETPLEDLNFWIASCDSCVEWKLHPKPFDIKNEKWLNSAKSDWGTTFYNGHIVFASDRGSGQQEQTVTSRPFLRFDLNKTPDKREYGWTGNRYLRLYQADKLADSSSIKSFSFAAGTDYHIGTATFTADGNEMYFTVTRLPKKWKNDSIKTINTEIYSSRKDVKSKQWAAPVAFKYNNVDSCSVGDPFITPDGQKLFFVSDKKGGLGGTDIYYCLRDEKGNWKKPVNLNAVNSPGNERTPTLDKAGNLYFASDSGLVMGGLDIFKAAKQDTTFGPRENLGYPINSPYDDFAIVTDDGLTGYFSSNRLGGKGSDDIYSFARKVAKFKLEGTVFDKNTNNPIPNSLVTLSSVNGNAVSVTTAADGKFKFDLAENNDYSLKGTSPGYLSDNSTTLSTKGLTASETLKRDLYLEKIVINKAIRLNIIYYDFDKANIRPDAARELDKLIKILQDNPTIHIELGSHTDSRGDDDYNMDLSERRARSATEYIIQKGGIDPERITAHGYGETQLLNRCANGVPCTEAEHQLNRRTEFKITSM